MTLMFETNDEIQRKLDYMRRMLPEGYEIVPVTKRRRAGVGRPKGSKASEATKAKMRAAHIGRKLSDETKRKISEARKHGFGARIKLLEDELRDVKAAHATYQRYGAITKDGQFVERDLSVYVE